MRIPLSGILIARIALYTATSSWLVSAGLAQAQAPATGAGRSPASAKTSVHAAWIPRTLDFTYRGITTHYTCEGLQQKLRHMLTMLGARDVSVRGYGCINLYGPEHAPSVNIRMQVLAPADPDSSAATIPARWQWTDLLTRRDPVEVSADCELVQQFRQSILPLFEPRSIDYRSTCVPRTPIPGTVRLRAEVLTQQ